MKVFTAPLTKGEVDELVSKYPIDKLIEPDNPPWSSQYDTRSAVINYAMVRFFKPKVVVEFGSRAGRCTRDIHRALLDNGKDFSFYPYELEEPSRMAANHNLKVEFGELAPEVRGNILEADDIPDGIDYLFVDNYHDEETTEWVFNYLLPKKCVNNCLVHFHDLRIQGDWNVISLHHGESVVIKKIYDEGNMKLHKVYWTYEEGTERSSAWFQYRR